MAHLNFGYVLLHWLGIPLAVVAWWENIDNWKGGALSILGGVSMICYAYLTYQKARKLKIENDSAEFEFNLKKYRSE